MKSYDIHLQFFLTILELQLGYWISSAICSASHKQNIFRSNTHRQNGFRVLLTDNSLKEYLEMQKWTNCIEKNDTHTNKRTVTLLTYTYKTL